jgi:hypothetical protein
MLHKEYYRKGSVKKSLVVGLKGLDAKSNWLAVNRQSYSKSDSDFDFDFDFDFDDPVQLSEATWSSWLVSEKVQLLEVSLWREEHEVCVKWPPA